MWHIGVHDGTMDTILYILNARRHTYVSGNKTSFGLCAKMYIITLVNYELHAGKRNGQMFKVQPPISQ
jgi:hypothetical protein